MRVLLFLSFLMLFAPRCATVKTPDAPVSDVMTSNSPSTSLKVMFWWWTQKEWDRGINMTAPPKKTVYSELTKWEYSDMEDSRYPHEVDMVAIFKNSRSLGRGEGVRFFSSGRYADDAELYGRNQETKETEFLSSFYDSLPWLNEEQIATEVVDLRSSDDEIAVSKELKLDKLLNSKSGNKYLCGVRVRMEFVNTEGIVTASNETSFRVTLGD